MSNAHRKELVRVSVDLTPEQHRHFKVKAAMNGVSMRRLIMQMLEKEGLIAESS